MAWCSGVDQMLQVLDTNENILGMERRHPKLHDLCRRVFEVYCEGAADMAALADQMQAMSRAAGVGVISLNKADAEDKLKAMSMFMEAAFMLGMLNGTYKTHEMGKDWMMKRITGQAVQSFDVLKPVVGDLDPLINLVSFHHMLGAQREPGQDMPEEFDRRIKADWQNALGAFNARTFGVEQGPKDGRIGRG